MMQIESAEVIEHGAAVAVRWQDGRRSRFHGFWLRDNAQDSATRSPTNGQRLLTLRDVPDDVRIARAEVAGGALNVELHPEAREFRFESGWLAAHAYDGGDAPAPERAPGWTGAQVERWDGAASLPQPLAFAAVTGDAASRRAWLAQVRRYGVARLSGVPVEPGAVCRVAELFGYVRETNYGRLFDVRSTVAASNLAYTNLGLQAHTDNPYRDPVPTLQLLACLQNSVDGGESAVVDGFSVAARLSPDHLQVLAGHCARFEYAGSAGIRLRAKRPVIELGPDGELLAVRFNNRSAAAVVDVPYRTMPVYYAALRQMAALIDDPALTQTFRLQPGELFIVDNTRVLHARTAFSGSGTRWLQGCYADRDGLLSTLAALEEECA